MAATYKSEFLRVMEERGFIHQGIDLETLDQKLLDGVVSGYIGFDATAPSLHCGSLLMIMLLHWLQKTGHRPVVLMGGGTTKIGDPTGKDTARKFLSEADIAANIAGIQQVFSRYLTFGEGPRDAVMVNNAEWLEGLNYLEFLRDYGRHFSINRMLTFDSVKLRLEREQSLSFLEFNYMILQAYDFVELNRRMGVTLQMGGSDQWGNIVNGVELGRRMQHADFYALTSPLLTTASGAKMGKSEGGAVWLNADMLSPYEFFQYWRNTADADVSRFLRLFTTLPMEEVRKLEALQGNEINEAKKVLAFEVTRLCHGDAAAQDAAETARKVFEEGAVGDDLPTIEVSLGAGLSDVDLLVQLGLCASKGEARRLIEQGGARKNDAPISGATSVSTAADARDGLIKLSAGKKRHGLVRVLG